jgi:hypothetical protein
MKHKQTQQLLKTLDVPRLKYGHLAFQKFSKGLDRAYRKKGRRPREESERNEPETQILTSLYTKHSGPTANQTHILDFYIMKG